MSIESGGGQPSFLIFDSGPNLSLYQQTVSENTSPSQHPQTEAGEERRCSVRRCAKVLSPGATTKMCHDCREKHRVYAHTKKETRRTEKATMVQVASSEQLLDTMSPPPQTAPSSSALASALGPISGSALSDDGLNQGMPTFRTCSTEECQNAISPDDQFEMCLACRGYGPVITVYQVAALRLQEGERCRNAGLLPLDESPKDLCAWECSVIEAKIPVITTYQSDENLSNDSVVSTPAANTDPTPTVGSITPINLPLSLPVSDIPMFPLPSSSSCSSAPKVAASSSPYFVSTSSLRPHMCIVSHCHTILLGTYPYKHCEEHRAQNRAHGRLRLEREKLWQSPSADYMFSTGGAITDGKQPIGNETNIENLPADDLSNELDYGSVIHADHSVSAKTVGKQRAGRAKTRSKRKNGQTIEQKTVNGEVAHMEVKINHSTTGVLVKKMEPEIIQSSNAKPSHLLDGKKKNFTCLQADCMNLLNPQQRWRMCSICRAVKSNQRQAQQQGTFDQPDTQMVRTDANPPRDADNKLLISVIKTDPSDSGPILVLDPATYKDRTKTHQPQQHAPHTHNHTQYTIPNRSATTVPSMASTPTAFASSYTYPYPYSFPISSPSAFVTSTNTATGQPVLAAVSTPGSVTPPMEKTYPTPSSAPSGIDPSSPACTEPSTANRPPAVAHTDERLPKASLSLNSQVTPGALKGARTGNWEAANVSPTASASVPAIISLPIPHYSPSVPLPTTTTFTFQPKSVTSAAGITKKLSPKSSSPAATKVSGITKADGTDVNLANNITTTVISPRTHPQALSDSLPDKPNNISQTSSPNESTQAALDHPLQAAAPVNHTHGLVDTDEDSCAPGASSSRKPAHHPYFASHPTQQSKFPPYTGKFSVIPAVNTPPPSPPKGGYIMNAGQPASTIPLNTTSASQGRRYSFAVAGVKPSGGAPASAFGKFRFDTPAPAPYPQYAYHTTSTISTDSSHIGTASERKHEEASNLSTDSSHGGTAAKRKHEEDRHHSVASRSEQRSDSSVNETKPNAISTATTQAPSIPGYPYYNYMQSSQYYIVPEATPPASQTFATPPVMGLNPPPPVKYYPYAVPPGLILPTASYSTYYPYSYGGPYTAHPPYSPYPGYGLYSYSGFPQTYVLPIPIPDSPSTSAPKKSRHEQGLDLRVRSKKKTKNELANTRKEVERATGASVESGETTSTQLGPVAAALRPLCITKSCRRPLVQIPTSSASGKSSTKLCVRCQKRFKKRRLRMKQRLKLVPKKTAVNASSQELQEDVAQVDDADGDADADIGETE
ncbi:hypothetical protein D9757_007095 [Collybiopsis confluens]|uniref:Uncharacterized protein n=1 Tax=Collybiopsis confluens TaxID=2823264 RepID=A0A8H5M4S7_9AGAR|nr:hypothetical protein D9757_007095 [Collybiopsis confluens]